MRYPARFLASALFVSAALGTIAMAAPAMNLNILQLEQNLHRVQAFQLSGEWRGAYYYQDGRPPVEFTMTLDADQDKCLGRISEANTFGDNTSARLTANVACSSMNVGPGSRFTFHKRYDGTANVNHSVEYTGIVSPSGKSITGTWHIGNMRGNFVMEYFGRR